MLMFMLLIMLLFVIYDLNYNSIMETIEQTKNSNENMNGNLSMLIEDQIFHFIGDVVLGIEKKNYSTLREKENFDELLKTRNGMFVGMNFLEIYLDTLYKKLVNKDDEFISDTFAEFGEKMKLNPVFSLNLIANVIMRVYPLFTRSKLNTENESVYLESVKNVTGTMKAYIVKIFNEDFNKLNEERKKNDSKNEI